MNKLQKVFNYGENEVRTIVDESGEIWFVAKDICDVLGILNRWDAISRLPERMKDDLGITDAIGRNQQTKIINEAGVYKLIFQSRKLEAEKFADWVSEEVLPALRKTGSYSMEPKSKAEAIKMIGEQMVEQEQRISRLEEEQAKTINYLTETPDRKKIVNKLNELARMDCIVSNKVAWDKVCSILKDKYGFDVITRRDNERKRLNEQRRLEGKRPYKNSTLKQKVTGLDVIENYGMLKETFEIIVGLIREHESELN